MSILYDSVSFSNLFKLCINKHCNMKRTIQRIANKDMKTCEGLQDIYVDFQESDIRNARALIMGPRKVPVTKMPFFCFEFAFPMIIHFHCPPSRIRSFQFHSNPPQFVCQWKGVFACFRNLEWSTLDIDYGFVFNFVFVDSVIVK